MLANLAHQITDLAARAPHDLPRPQLRDVVVLAALLGAAVAGVI